MIKNIVFSGAGLKCWAYIGTLRALQEYKTPDLEEVLGVSAGSVFGLFYILGIKWEFLLDFFINLNFKELFDIDIDNILVQQSFLAGIKFTNILKEIIKYYIDPDITFNELRAYSKITFTVNALNITDSVLVYFNYKLTPNIKIIDAIRASCCLPIIFPPYRIGDNFYYDGGIYNNCPIELFDEVDSIAFDVSFYPEKNTSNLTLMNLLNSLIKMVNKTKCTDSYNIYTILDDSFNSQLLNLNQSRDDIFNIYMHGYINSKNILFKNHIALPAP